MEKKCNVCGILKPLDDFHKKKTGNMGRMELCKVCKKKKDSDRWKRGLTEEQKEKRKLYLKTYYENNKEKYIKRRENITKEYWNKYQKRKREKYPIQKMKDSIRTRVNKYLRDRKYSKNVKTFSMIGLSPEQLKEHISKGFVDEMSWDNYGKWHIDHIVPLSSAKSEEELIKLFHHTNLQPLWAKDNFRKSNKLFGNS